MKNAAPILIPLLITIGATFAIMLFCAGMLAIFIIFGADKALTIVLVNNSGQGLTVTSGATVIPVAQSAASAGFIPNSTVPVFVVRTADGRIWKYRWAPLAGPYAHLHPVYLQIEADGTVYVLPVKAAGVTKPLPPQPAGYPLKPQ